jgi:hypothetical protein
MYSNLYETKVIHLFMARVSISLMEDVFSQFFLYSLDSENKVVPTKNSDLWPVQPCYRKQLKSVASYDLIHMFCIPRECYYIHDHLGHISLDWSFLKEKNWLAKFGC